MKKVRVIKRYNDLQKKAIQEKGAEFEVDDKRAEHLVKQGMVEIIENAEYEKEYHINRKIYD